MYVQKCKPWPLLNIIYKNYLETNCKTTLHVRIKSIKLMEENGMTFNSSMPLNPRSEISWKRNKKINHKREIDKRDFIKIEILVFQVTLLRKCKSSSNSETIFAKLTFDKELTLRNINKNLLQCNNNKRNNAIFKMLKWLEQIL